MTGHVLVRGVAFEYDAAPESAWLLGDGSQHDAYRITYRAAGETRRSRVLLLDHDHEPTAEEVCVAIAFHRFGELAEPFNTVESQEVVYRGECRGQV